jgi:RDD family/Septum formation
MAGEASVGGGAFSFYLEGSGEALWVALALGYYLVLEATIGQTVGKLLVGVRVVRAGGGRPNVLEVATRTLVRVVDWLPALYLVGFLVMLATGARRQRLGDLAANTRIARAVPLRHRGLAATGLASSLVLVLAGSVVYAASYQDTGAQTYHGNGVSFDYPAGWEEGTRRVAAETGTADEIWEVAFGLDSASVVSVTAYRMNMPVTAEYPENLDAAKAQSDEMVREWFEQNGGTVEAGPEEITVAGMPGLRFRATGTLGGTSFESTIVLIFDGATEYNLNCQHTSEWAEEVERGCEQIVHTFRVDVVETASTVPPAAETSAPAQAEETGPTGTEDVDIADLEVGDCLAESLPGEGEEISSIHTLPCSASHSEEIFAAMTRPEGQGDFPGMEAITAQAEGFCVAEFEDFVGLSYAKSALYLGLVTPSEESWSQGDRSILCTIYDPAGQVSGSLRNVER